MARIHHVMRRTSVIGTEFFTKLHYRMSPRPIGSRTGHSEAHRQRNHFRPVQASSNKQEYVRLDTASSHLFFAYGQLQPGPLEQKLVAQKRTNMERRRDCAKSFTVNRSFSALGISNLFKNPSSTWHFVPLYTPCVAAMVPFPRWGHEKLPRTSSYFSPSTDSVAPTRAEHGNGGRKNGNASRSFEIL